MYAGREHRTAFFIFRWGKVDTVSMLLSHEMEILGSLYNTWIDKVGNTLHGSPLIQSWLGRSIQRMPSMKLSQISLSLSFRKGRLAKNERLWRIKFLSSVKRKTAYIGCSCTPLFSVPTLRRSFCCKNAAPQYHLYAPFIRENIASRNKKKNKRERLIERGCTLLLSKYVFSIIGLSLWSSKLGSSNVYRRYSVFFKRTFV